MSIQIADHVRDIPRSGIRDFFEIVQSMDDVISLGIGEPDFATPWHIREAAIYSLEKGRTGYTSNLGLPRLRRAISSYVEDHFGVYYEPLSEVLVSVGVSEAIDIALRAILNPSDEVLYHEPCYVSYSPSVVLARGVARAIPTKASDHFVLRAEALERAITPRSKLLMLNFPTNPTGATMPGEELEKIAGSLRQARPDCAVGRNLQRIDLRLRRASVFGRVAWHERAHDPSSRRVEGLRNDRMANRFLPARRNR